MAVRALEIGASGLRAESDAIGIAGDNIANVNTPGFKRQRAIFEDVFSRGGNTGGVGTLLGDIGQAFTQGALVNTGIGTDVALGGEGFFVVSGTVNGLTGNFYSRAGLFRADASGHIVDPSGLDVMGRTLGANGKLSVGLAPLTVPTSGIPAQATTQIGLAANLDASAPALAAPFDLTQPTPAATTATSVVVYDSLGAPHSLDVYLNKLADNQWEYRAVVSGDELNPTQPGVNVEVGSGQLTFDTDGALTTVSENQAISVDFLSATPGQLIDLSFGTSISDGGTGLDGTTQFSMRSAVSSLSQNGFSAGALSGISFTPDGTLMASYTNGRSAPIGQLQVARFRATDGLARAGNNLWVETSESGQATLAPPGAGGRGQVTAGAIETSNVDVGEEMVTMIQLQRAFSASSKVIATADEMLSQLMQLKR